MSVVGERKLSVDRKKLYGGVISTKVVDYVARNINKQEKLCEIYQRDREIYYPLCCSVSICVAAAV